MRPDAGLDASRRKEQGFGAARLSSAALARARGRAPR
jgi:hypothetical protein